MQLDLAIKELLTQERGLSILSAVFSQIMTAPPTQPGASPVTEILNAIVRAYPATEAPGPFEPGSPEWLRHSAEDAFILAAFDQMAKGNAPVAGEAWWWALSGGAGAGLAEKAVHRIIFLEASSAASLVALSKQKTS